MERQPKQSERGHLVAERGREERENFKGVLKRHRLDFLFFIFVLSYFGLGLGFRKDCASQTGLASKYLGYDTTSKIRV